MGERTVDIWRFQFSATSQMHFDYMGAASKPCDHAQHLRQHHHSSVFDTHWYPGPRDVHICSPTADHVTKRMPYKGHQRAENWIEVRK